MDAIRSRANAMANHAIMQTRLVPSNSEPVIIQVLIIHLSFIFIYDFFMALGTFSLCFGYSKKGT